MESINNVRQRIMEIQKRFQMLTPQRLSQSSSPKVAVSSQKEVQETEVPSIEDFTKILDSQKTTSPSKSPHWNIASQKAKQYGLPESLLRAVIDQESGWKKDAISSKGAMGLMQLMPETANSLGVKDPYSPEQNIDGGVRYLKDLLNQFSGDIVKALAAYNAGVQAVHTRQGVPKYEETQDYVRKIIAKYMRYSGVSSQ